MAIRQSLQNDQSLSGVNVTKQTISNDLHRDSIKSHSPRKTPLLLKWHRDARLKFATEHKDKENYYWERVLWTDKSKIELFRRNFLNHVWRKEGEAYAPKNNIPTLKFGGAAF